MVKFNFYGALSYGMCMILLFVATLFLLNIVIWDFGFTKEILMMEKFLYRLGIFLIILASIIRGLEKNGN